MANLDLLIRADDQASATLSNVQGLLRKATDEARRFAAATTGGGNEMLGVYAQVTQSVKAQATASNSAFNTISARAAAAGASISAVAAASVEATGAVQALGISSALAWTRMLGPLGLVVAGVAALTKGVSEVSQSQDAVRRLGAAFTATGQDVGKSTEKATEWAESLSRITGIADNQLLDSLGNIVRKVGDVSTAMRVGRLATDLAAASGGSFSEISNNLAQALSGNSRGLMMLQRDYKELLRGVTDGGQALTILEQKFGGSAEKATGLSDNMGRLKNNLSNMAKELGSTVTPALDELLGKLVKLTTTTTEKEDIDRQTLRTSEAMVGHLQRLRDAQQSWVEWVNRSDTRKNQYDTKSTEEFIVRLDQAIKKQKELDEVRSRPPKGFQGGKTPEQIREEKQAEENAKKVAEDAIARMREVQDEFKKIESDKIGLMEAGLEKQIKTIEARRDADIMALRDRARKSQEIAEASAVLEKGIRDQSDAEILKAREDFLVEFADLEKHSQMESLKMSSDKLESKLRIIDLETDAEVEHIRKRGEAAKIGADRIAALEDEARDRGRERRRQAEEDSDAIGKAGLYAANQIKEGFAQAYADSLVKGEDFGKAMDDLFKRILANLVAKIIESGITEALAGIFKATATGGASAAGGGGGFSGIIGGLLGFDHGTQRVPGPVGSPRLAVVHGGETIQSAGTPMGANSSGGMGGGGSSVYNINVSLQVADLGPSERARVIEALTEEIRSATDAGRAFAGEAALLASRNSERVS